MKTLLLFVSLAILGTLNVNTASATNRSLVCTQANQDNITIGICGVRGCNATTSTNGTIQKYLFNRTKNTDGSLVYATRAGARPRCTVSISSLRNGVRSVVSASCKSSLRRSPCVFKDN